MISGIYRIENLLDGKVYVGSALRIPTRRSHHLGMLRRGCHDNRHLQRAWLRDGEAAFAFQIIETCNPLSLIEQEQKWIDHYWPHVYNLRRRAESMLGFKHSTETVAAMRARPVSLETRAKIAAANKMRCPESWDKMAATKRGKPLSAEHKQKLMGRPSWNKGLKWSEEMRAKLSLAHKGKPRPWRIGMKHSETTRQLMSEKRRLRVCSEETKAKMSASGKRAWEKRHYIP